MARDSRELQQILRASGKTALNLDALPGEVLPSDDELLAAVREVAEGQFDVLGEMGRGRKGSVVYLARDESSQQLVALKLQDEGNGDYALEVVQQLDNTLPAVEGSCGSCGAVQEGWGRFCTNCGADLSGTPDGTDSPAELLQAVRDAAADRFEVLGEMDRAEGGGRVYFARDSGNQRIIALRLQRERDAFGKDDYVLAKTQVLKPLAASMDATVVQPAVPGNRPLSDRPMFSDGEPRRAPRAADTFAAAARRIEANRRVLALAGLVAIVAAGAIVVALRGGESATNRGTLPEAPIIEAVPRAASDSADLEVRGDNVPADARITVNGTRMAVGSRVTLPVGEHVLAIRAPGYRPIVDSINLSAGQILQYAIPGMQRVGRVRPAPQTRRVEPEERRADPPPPVQRTPEPQPAAPDLQCRRVYQSGDYGRARTACGREAEAGDATADYYMGRMYEFGEGGSQDDGRAAEHYIDAVASGNLDALLPLGLMFQEGVGVPRNESRAVDLFRESALGGNAEAMAYLGDAYLRGRGVERSAVQALAWFTRGADDGHAWSQYLLGMLLLQGGDGVAADPAQAARWFTGAAQQNLPTAQYELGISYRDGRGVAPSDSAAVYWLERASNAGVPQAQQALRELRGQ